MTSNKETITAEVGALQPAATLELLGASDRLGAVCATLTPAIRATLQELQLGQILLVRVDDPSARLDVPAWCALTGNVLQAITEEEGGVLSFFIRKERKR
jgi:tRNA 2-thiouridine synthesizing protein A